jgi:hypothetical protein
MKYILITLLLPILIGCGSHPPREVSHNSSELVASTRMQTFPNARAARSVNRSNADIAQEFLDLSFALESGQNISHLTKFSGPHFCFNYRISTGLCGA